MISAILKNDIRTNKNNLIIWLILIVIYSAIFIPSQGLGPTVIINLIITYTIVFAVLNTNLNSGWYSFLLTTRADRKLIVKSLLTFAVLGQLLAIVITYLIFLIMMVFVPRLSLQEMFSPETLLTISLGFSLQFLINEIVITIAFKYSIDTSRIAYFLIILALAVIIIGLCYLVWILGIPVSDNAVFLSLYAFGMAVLWVFIFIFYRILIKVVLNKEF